MQLDLERLAKHIGWGILERMSLEQEVMQLKTENDGLRIALEDGGEAHDERGTNERPVPSGSQGHQGA